MTDSFEQIVIQNRNLAEELLALVADATPAFAESELGRPPQESDAIVYAFEINDNHGVGVLVRRLFGESRNVISIHSKSLYGGHQEFGAMHLRISHQDSRPEQVLRTVLEAIGNATVRRVLCIPFLPDDALTAMALKEAFGVPLCTYIMDDQNLCVEGISDGIMAELLAKSSLVLAISPEMCDGYEKKYGRKVWFMPPLAPSRLIPERLNVIASDVMRQNPPVILGNIWGQQWVELLRETVRASGITLRWYNNGEFRWLPCTKEALVKDGIIPQPDKPDDDALVEILRAAPFVVLPSGTLDENDDRRFIAQMSFPSRIPYILATSHTPILVMGNAQTAAARLVRRLGIGTVAPYERVAFLAAVDRITNPEVNLAMRRAAYLLSIRFADVGAGEWLWHSITKGEPVDHRFEDLRPGSDPDAVMPWSYLADSNKIGR